MGGLEVFESLLFVVVDEMVDEFGHVAEDDFVEGVEGEVDAVVGESVLGEVVGSDALGAVAGADHVFSGGVTFGAFFLLVVVEDTAAEEAPGFGAVFVL